jgi:Ca2+-binding EF-hand superfamily protein
MKMNEIFKAFDRNYDGVLSKEELIAGFKQAYGSQHLAIQEVAFILSKLDLNGL